MSGLLRRSAALVAALRRIVALISLIWLIHVLRHKDSPLSAVDEHQNQPTGTRRPAAERWLPDKVPLCTDRHELRRERA